MPFQKTELMLWLIMQDCEFTYLSTQILHLLGLEGPATKEPSKYIRYIYNRIILENATVRAAAVSSLAKFGATVAELKDEIIVLLQRALYDNDDEVRRLVHLSFSLHAASLSFDPPFPLSFCCSSQGTNIGIARCLIGVSFLLGRNSLS